MNSAAYLSPITSSPVLLQYCGDLAMALMVEAAACISTISPRSLAPSSCAIANGERVGRRLMDPRTPGTRIMANGGRRSRPCPLLPRIAARPPTIHCVPNSTSTHALAAADRLAQCAVSMILAGWVY